MAGIGFECNWEMSMNRSHFGQQVCMAVGAGAFGRRSSMKNSPTKKLVGAGWLFM